MRLEDQEFFDTFKAVKSNLLNNYMDSAVNSNHLKVSYDRTFSPYE